MISRIIKMNRFGIYFSDPVLEQNYETRQQATIRYPIFRILSITGFVFMLPSSISQFVKGESDSLIQAALSIFTLVQLLVIHYHQRFVNYALFILSLVYLITFYVISEPQGQGNVQIMQFALMIAHMTAIRFQDLRIAFVQILVCTFIVFYQNGRHGQMPDPYFIALYTWVSAIDIYGIYKYQQQNRQYYLLSHKDTQLNLMLSKVAAKRVVIFDFDEEQFKFREIFSSKLDLKCILKSRKSNGTLSEYIYARMNQFKTGIDDYFSEDFTIINQNRLLSVNLSEFYLEKKTFMIIIDEIPFTESKQLAINKIKTFSAKNIRLWLEMLYSQQNPKILQCRMLFMWLGSYQKQVYEQNKTFRAVNLNCIIKFYWNLLQQTYKEKKFHFYAGDTYTINTIEPLLQLVMIDAFQQFKRYSEAFCKIDLIQPFIIIQITTAQDFYPSPIRYRLEALNKIIHKIDILQNGIIFDYIRFQNLYSDRQGQSLKFFLMLQECYYYQYLFDEVKYFFYTVFNYNFELLLRFRFRIIFETRNLVHISLFSKLLNYMLKNEFSFDIFLNFDYQSFDHNQKSIIHFELQRSQQNSIK